MLAFARRETIGLTGGFAVDLAKGIIRYRERRVDYGSLVCTCNGAGAGVVGP